MAIRYANTPQLIYGKYRAPQVELPSNAQPIRSAPENGSSPTWIFENNGDAYRSLFHRGQWMKLQPERDQHTGGYRWRMTGERVAQPIAWLPGDFEPPR